MDFNRKKSKLELYQMKLKERDNNNENYFFDILTNNNNRFSKTINLNNDSLKNEENKGINENNHILNRNATPNPNNLNNNYKSNHQSTLNQNLNQTDLFVNYNNSNNNIQNENNHFNNINNNFNFSSENNNNINYLKNLNSNNHRANAQSLKNIYNTNRNGNNNLLNDPYGNTYKGTHILPRDRGNNEKEDKFNQNQMLRNIWAEEMREKKIREEKEKQKEKELDLLEDERIKREIEEEKQKEEEEKQRKKEKEKNLVNDNVQLIQNKKNLVENGNNEYSPNIFNNNNDLINQELYLDKKLNYYNSRKNEYRNIDLNNIHFFRRNNKVNMNQQLYYKNKIRNTQNQNMNRRVNEFEFAPNPRQLDDSKNPQISRLKKEVNSGYMEISSLFKQLKNNVIEANQNRNRAEKELKYITDEINKEKKYRMELERKRYEQMKPEEINNYYYANVRDVDPIYYTKNETKIEENNISNLARAGQNLIALKAQSEFIPVGSNTYDNKIIIEENIDPNNNIAISDELGKNNMEIESETIFQPNENGNY